MYEDILKIYENYYEHIYSNKFIFEHVYFRIFCKYLKIVINIFTHRHTLKIYTILIRNILSFYTL